MRICSIVYILSHGGSSQADPFTNILFITLFCQSFIKEIFNATCKNWNIINDVNIYEMLFTKCSTLPQNVPYVVRFCKMQFTDCNRTVNNNQKPCLDIAMCFSFVESSIQLFVWQHSRGSVSFLRPYATTGARQY